MGAAVIFLTSKFRKTPFSKFEKIEVKLPRWKDFHRRFHTNILICVYKVDANYRK